MLFLWQITWDLLHALSHAHNDTWHGLWRTSRQHWLNMLKQVDSVQIECGCQGEWNRPGAKQLIFGWLTHMLWAYATSLPHHEWELNHKLVVLQPVQIWSNLIMFTSAFRACSPYRDRYHRVQCLPVLIQSLALSILRRGLCSDGWLVRKWDRHRG